MIGAVGQTESSSRRAPLEAVTDPRPDDHPALFGGSVKATGRTPAGLLVQLVEWDDERAVDDSSEYDAWPEDEPKDAPPLMLGRLLVELTDAEGVMGVAGVVSWHRVAYGPNPGSHAWNIGIGLAPASRGHGVGAVAQRLLAEWLLATTATSRIEASTDVANIAEQKALERAGFVREGTLRSAQRRADGRHDLYGYSLLRTDL
jgi:RimJ/RimL family protein N-acetyltransferase